MTCHGRLPRHGVGGCETLQNYRSFPGTPSDPGARFQESFRNTSPRPGCGPISSLDLSDDLCWITHNAGARGNIPSHQCASIYPGTCADSHSFQNRRVGTYPDIVFDDDRSAWNFRSGTSFAQRRTRNGVGDALGRSQWMKIGIGDCGIPTNHNVFAKTQLHFAKKDGVSEITVIAYGNPTLLTHCEMHPVHRAV